ncbi:outer membrane protein assembly factor BamE domain-containing protein [Candidatus Liberibacter brunswickensis]|uniref:outer membrane protein assembly factor BamE domain-containing protein n=1 Tax=Candidatus Liberibacter brunswickensis TaxID=1968796 RepID=UPI002FE2118C
MKKVFFFTSLMFAVFHSSYKVANGLDLDSASVSLVSVKSSRKHVLQSLGSPSFAIIDSNGFQSFYYISQNKKVPIFGFLSPKILERTILKIHFNKEDLVSSLSIKKHPNKKFFPNKRRTPAPIQRTDGFFSRLINSGRRTA